MTLIEARLISDAGLELGFLHELDPREEAALEWSNDIDEFDVEDEDVAADRCALNARNRKSAR